MFSVSESLPNVTGSAIGIEGKRGSQTASGCFTYTNTAGGYYNNVNAGTQGDYSFSASNSSSVYQDGSSVRPKSRKVKYFIRWRK